MKTFILFFIIGYSFYYLSGMKVTFSTSVSVNIVNLATTFQGISISGGVAPIYTFEAKSTGVFEKSFLELIKK